MVNCKVGSFRNAVGEEFNMRSPRIYTSGKKPALVVLLSMQEISLD